MSFSFEGESRVNMRMPVWKQARGSFGNNYWQFYSFKLGRVVHFYSNLEWDHGVLIESDPNILWYCEQPIKIRIKVEGHDRETVLDMLVRYQDGREEYREVKYQSDLDQQVKRATMTRQLKAQSSWAQVTANDYRIVTETEIRKNRLFLKNWRRVLAHLASTAEEPLEDIEEQVLKAYATKSVWRLSDIEQFCCPVSSQLCRAAVYRLIHRGILSAPLDEFPLTNTINVRRSYLR